jgi:glycosyltransferase involved in cell wall biosynthesis
MKNLVSAFVICQDEIKTIAYTIESIRKVADEIVVVDSGSTDGTLEYLKNQKDIVLKHHPFKDYVSQKEYAQSLCRYEWLLNLDADEELSEQCIEEINIIRQDSSMQPKVYALNFYFVDPIKEYKSTLNPFIKAVRFYHKDVAAYTTTIDSLYKDRPLIKDNIKTLLIKGAVWHRSKKNTTQLLRKINDYTDLQAKEMYQKNKKTYPFLSFLLIPFLFFKFYILRRYFMLGLPGLYDSFIWALARFLRDLKVYEKSRT